MYLSDIGFEEAVLLWKRSISPSLAREIALHPVSTKFGRQEVKLTNHLANLSQDSCEQMCKILLRVFRGLSWKWMYLSNLWACKHGFYKDDSFQGFPKLFRE